MYAYSARRARLLSTRGCARWKTNWPRETQNYPAQRLRNPNSDRYVFLRFLRPTWLRRPRHPALTDAAHAAVGFELEQMRNQRGLRERMQAWIDVVVHAHHQRL